MFQETRWKLNCLFWFSLRSTQWTPTTFYLFLVSHSGGRISFYCPDEGGTKSHCKRASWMENVVMTLFENYNSPWTLFGQFEKEWGDCIFMFGREVYLAFYHTNKSWITFKCPVFKMLPFFIRIALRCMGTNRCDFIYIAHLPITII